MNARSLYVLIAAAVVAVGAAVALRSLHAPRTDADERDQPLLPALRGHVNDVSGITVTGAGGKVVVTLVRGKDGWTIAERSGYPADIGPIRELLVKLDRATLVEPKTGNPKRYRDIGVDDVKDAGAKGVHVDLAGLANPVGLIVGTFGPSSGTFVRRDGEAQSWLASGNLDVPKTVAGWEKRDVVDLPAARLASISLRAPGGGKLDLYREHANDASFKVVDVPAGRKVEQGQAATVAAALSGLRVDDVAAAKDAPPPERTHKALYVAFDGVGVDAVAWTKGGKNYAQLAAKLDRAAARNRIVDDQARAKSAYEAAVAAHADHAPPKPLAVSDPASDLQARLDALDGQVDALNRAFSGWTFVVSSYVFDNMTRTMSDMLVPIEAKKDDGVAHGRPATKPRAAPD